ncbi:MAG: bifunctional molybdenum cofactor biosynthesis protein MoaC/MoaB, partial [Thermodesulfobacteriota bacterium]
AEVICAPKTIRTIKKNEVPKGDVLDFARVAGITAAKKTSEIIPLCHQVPLDFVNVEFEITKNKITIRTEVTAIWKTGVEMEALTAASVSALTLYDMLKPIDESLEIQNIKLLEKTGGKSDFKQKFKKPLKTAVLVFSDSISSGKKADKSGKTIVEKLKNQPVKVAEYKIYPDDQNIIINELIKLSDNKKFDLILTTGGTGLSPTDVTIEATNKVIEKDVPGISEAVRIYGFSRTPYAMLSRGVSGIRGQTLIINLPGSTRGVAESMDALFPWVLHSFWILSGGGHSIK